MVEVGTEEGCLTTGGEGWVTVMTESAAAQTTSITPTTATPARLRRSLTRAYQSSQTATARSATATTWSTSKVYRAKRRERRQAGGTVTANGMRLSNMIANRETVYSGGRGGQPGTGSG